MAECYRGTCMDCGEEKMVWIINEVTTLCEDCAADRDLERCDICEEWYPYDQVEFTELPDGRNVCEYCMEDV